MNPVEVQRTIAAPLGVVFATVSDVRNFRQAVPHITKVEFLTDQQVGAGTRFRETREMNGREQSVELEVAEYVTDDRVRMVSDAGGTIWDTTFTVLQDGDDVELLMVMDVRPKNIFARLMNRLIRGMVVKAIEADMDAVKQYCETHGERAEPTS